MPNYFTTRNTKIFPSLFTAWLVRRGKQSTAVWQAARRNSTENLQCFHCILTFYCYLK